MAAGRVMPPDSLRSATRQEWAARLFVVLLLVGLPLAILFAGRPESGAITLSAMMPESGGWRPGHLAARVGEPLHLRLTSDDVVHGFAVGVAPDGRPHNSPEVEVKPGQITELTLSFEQPGTYTFYCTRWCGPNHWRMRGTIEVARDDDARPAASAAPPLFVELGLDIDAPHPAPAVPADTPSAARGAALDIVFPPALLEADAYMTQSPAEVWLALRELPALSHLDDAMLWDAVAGLWRQEADEETLALGKAFYAKNCAACHGENGAGDGVFAQAAPGVAEAMPGRTAGAATDFTDPALLGASNALLHGKIIRGGMGTGMPAWGTIFSDEEIRALLAYLWTFQFPAEGE